MSYNLNESMESFPPKYHTTAIRAWDAMPEFIAKIAIMIHK